MPCVSVLGAREIVAGQTHQNVVLSTTILMLPGSLLSFVNVSSSSIAWSDSSMLSSDMTSSASHSCRNHGGEPDERKMPAAAAWVSAGLRDADGLLAPREFLAMRMCDGFVVIDGRLREATIAARTPSTSSTASGMRGK